MIEQYQEKLNQAVDYAEREALKLGLDGIRVSGGVNRILSTRFANSEILQNFVDFEIRLNLTTYLGKKQVTLYNNDLSESHIGASLGQALKLLRVIPEDPNAPGLGSESERYPSLKLNDPQVRNITPSEIADLIVGGINISHEHSPKVTSVSGNVNFCDGFTFFRSSEGSENITPETKITSTVNVKSEESGEESRSNSNFGSRVLAQLPFDAESSSVAERSVMGLNPQKIEPNKYNVILDNQAMSQMMFLLGNAASGRQVAIQQSFLAGKQGEQMFDPPITVLHDPHDPVLVSSRPLDAEGVASRKYSLVEDGFFKSYALDRVSAGRLNQTSNGSSFSLFNTYTMPFPYATKMSPGKTNREDLLSEVSSGLVVTNWHYTNFIDYNRGTITGMTKDGLFIVENGEIVGSARNLRFTESIPNLLSSIQLSQERVQVVSPYGITFLVPSAKIPSFNLIS